MHKINSQLFLSTSSHIFKKLATVPPQKQTLKNPQNPHQPCSTYLQ